MSENKKSKIPAVDGLAGGEENPKNIIVRNKIGLTRRARKSELKWFADRGFHPEENQKSVASSQKSES